MTVFDPSACRPGRHSAAIIGGTPLGKRTIWWNLVASRKELREKAKENWREGRFPKVPDETEFIPLP
jgi:redox-sensitive bicupin YhaK (pirin superfamily)